MGLSGRQREKLKEALVDAFPTKAPLEQMLSFELDKNLDEIAGGKDLQEIVFNLIRKAEAEGWIEELILAARKANPGNPKLQAIELTSGGEISSRNTGFKLADKTVILVQSGDVVIIKDDINLGKKFDSLKPVYTPKDIVKLDRQLDRFPRLQQLLSEKNWRKADKETLTVMCKIKGKTSTQNLSVDDIRSFPYEDLRIIDWLWLKYSDWRFGFSVQSLIFEQVDYTLMQRSNHL